MLAFSLFRDAILYVFFSECRVCTYSAQQRRGKLQQAPRLIQGPPARARTRRNFGPYPSHSCLSWAITRARETGCGQVSDRYVEISSSSHILPPPQRSSSALMGHGSVDAHTYCRGSCVCGWVRKPVSGCCPGFRSDMETGPSVGVGNQTSTYMYIPVCSG